MMNKETKTVLAFVNEHDKLKQECIEYLDAPDRTQCIKEVVSDFCFEELPFLSLPTILLEYSLDNVYWDVVSRTIKLETEDG